MGRYLALALAVAVGALTTVQSAINTELGKHIGGIAAALVSFVVGTSTLAVFYLVSGEGGIKGLTRVSPYLWMGGILGAIFVFGIIKLIPQIGVGSAMAGVIAGQLLLAMVIDNFGWFGLTKYPVNWVRLLGAALLLAGVRLMGK